MKRILLLLMLTASFTTLYAQSANDVVGKWINSSGEAHIQIYKKGGAYFGKIVWLKSPNNENGKVKVDEKNPSVNLQSRPILGLEIVKNLKFSDDYWDDGTIYDPKSGKTYSSKITLKGNNQINLRGYIGLSLIGRSEVWTKVK
jgi:uncharacterized protein (DUF2147 family)